MENRQRKVDIDKLTEEQAELLQKEIAKKLAEITEQACAEANKILNVYGLKALMAIQIEKKE